MVEYPICPKCETSLNNNIGHFFDYVPDGHGGTIQISIDFCISCGYPITSKSGKKVK
ncbi:MAG: hypothetical protein JSW00_02780 [Thermoplasmata archaeon]|nr:MAG: hypothetical protein JSW00_02780 [Thermoplasmata archaeon]